MASNKGKTHMAALPVNVPPETNGGHLVYPSAAQDTENQRAMPEGSPPVNIRKGSMPRRRTSQVHRTRLPRQQHLCGKNG